MGKHDHNSKRKIRCPNTLIQVVLCPILWCSSRDDLHWCRPKKRRNFMHI